MGSKLSEVINDGKCIGYSFDCPGCDRTHVFWTDQVGYPKWNFNGNLEIPSFTPSLKNTWHGPQNTEEICHLVLTDGIINFCGDCTHSLAGKSVPMKDQSLQLPTNP